MRTMIWFFAMCMEQNYRDYIASKGATPYLSPKNLGVPGCLVMTLLVLGSATLCVLQDLADIH